MNYKNMNAKNRIIFFSMQIFWVALTSLTLLFPLAVVITSIPLIILTALFFVKNCRVNIIVMATAQIAVSVSSRGDLIYVLSAILTVGGSLVVIWALKWQLYRVGAGIAGLTMLVLALLPLVIYCPAQKKTPAALVTDYITENAEVKQIVFTSGSQIRLASKVFYLFYKEDGYEKLKRTDPGYTDEAVRAAAETIAEWGKADMFYDIMGAAVYFGLASYLAVLAVNAHTKKMIFKSSRAFKIKTAGIKFADMRLDRKYFLYVFLPIMAFALLGYVGTLAPAAAAVVSAFVTVPCGFAALALLYHSLARIKSKWRFALYAGLGILWSFCTLFSMAMLVISFLGLADSLINVRRLLDFAVGPVKDNKKENTEVTDNESDTDERR